VPRACPFFDHSVEILTPIFRRSKSVPKDANRCWRRLDVKVRCCPPLCCVDRFSSGDIDRSMLQDRIEGSGFHLCQSEMLPLKVAV
jgi:hypothetical protein